MKSKNSILALCLASALASGIAEGNEPDASHPSNAVADLGFELPVSALNNCLAACRT